MDVFALLPILVVVTLLAVVLFALFSKKKVEERRHDPDAPKSTLAADAPNTGTGAAQED